MLKSGEIPDQVLRVIQRYQMKQKALEKEKDRQGKRKYEADRRRVLYERKRLEVIKEKRRKLLALDERDENGKIVIRLGHNNSKSHTNSTQS